MRVHLKMYAPREDSFFLSETLKGYLKKKDKKIKIIDLGTGSGIQAETCKNLGFKDTLALDIDRASVDFVRRKKIKAIQSDLFSKISKKDKFDLIIFNPPYLPEDKHDKGQDTSGGKLGDEVIIKFLNQARSYLDKRGDILLLLSSLTPRDRINKIIEKYYKAEKLGEKKIFFEKLEIWKIKEKSSR
ncbi:MAG: methyltransferase [Proteobacteria bacterium]|nr:methyltransferase [Pseudomonadota bacterium]